MKTEFAELKNTILEKTKHKQTFYFPTSGCFAHTIINYATEKMFEEINLRYTQIHAIDFKTAIKALLFGATFIFGGGARWAQKWEKIQKNVNNALLLKKFNRSIQIIILPSTFEYPYKLTKVTAFASDNSESLMNVPSAEFCPDMAFYIAPMNVIPSMTTGYFFRRDEQSAKVIDIPTINMDLINSGSKQAHIKTFYQKLAEYGIIYTDSLHVAIAACQLGREVHLYPDISHKNKAVFECSIKTNFNNVYFHEDFKFIAPTSIVN